MLTADPIQLLHDETRALAGVVPRTLGGVRVEDGEHRLEGDALLLRAAGGIGAYYRKGEGVRTALSDDSQRSELDLYLHGTVHAGIAAINGLFPIHASAVVANGKAWAFTGPSGCGKSTLAAALAGQGMPLLCDDTLILDLAGSGEPMALPGHKWLKLWDEGLTLCGLSGAGQVSAEYPKQFVDLPHASTEQCVPLGGIFFLENGATFAAEPITGGSKLARLNDGHYTATLLDRAHADTPGGAFALRADLARRVPMARLVRPMDAVHFAQTTAAVMATIRAIAGR